MYEVPQSNVRQWSQTGGHWFPASFAVFCPDCGEHGVFTVREQQCYQKNVIATAICPACSSRSLIIAIGTSSTNEKQCAFLGMYPAPRGQRQPIAGADLLPDDLREEYVSLLEAYNFRIWRAVVTQCRVALEGIVSHLDPAGSGQLHQRLPDKVDLASPIHKLADQLRKGGNTGAHFDPKRKPDEQDAVAMLELTEYLLEYIYALPELVKKLQERLEKMPVPAPTAE
jgi:hypothetical protein